MCGSHRRHYQLSARAQAWYDQKYWFQADSCAEHDHRWDVSEMDFSQMVMEQPWGGLSGLRDLRETIDWFGDAILPAAGPECLRILYHLRYS